MAILSAAMTVLGSRWNALKADVSFGNGGINRTLACFLEGE